MSKPVTLLSVYGDYMLSYAISRKVQLFKLSANGGTRPVTVNIEALWVLDILDHVGSPYCIVSLSLICMGSDNKGLTADCIF